MQQLHAAGFNAWSQLRFEKPDIEASIQAGSADSEPDDIATFACVLEDAEILDVRPFLTSTAVTTSRGVLTAGAVPAGAGDAEGYYYSEALNGRVVAHDKNGTIRQYASSDHFLRRHEDAVPCTRFTGFSEIVQTVAYDTGFAALTADGQVWTWGDSRFLECLGRDVTDESPAHRPGRVTSLDNLPTGPIIKIAAGGYVLAALTRGRDLYCWGGYPGRRPVLAGLTGEPAPVVVALGGDDADGALDIDLVDVGVGDAHMIVLTADGSVCIVGSNTNGQLGIGPGATDDGQPPAWVSVWVNVESLPVREGRRVAGVYAGPRCSFVVVDE